MLIRIEEKSSFGPYVTQQFGTWRKVSDISPRSGKAGQQNLRYGSCSATMMIYLRFAVLYEDIVGAVSHLLLSTSLLLRNADFTVRGRRRTDLEINPAHTEH
ncbi:MAG TPA: hypothetical protein VK669_02925 [Candidatus Limnocylindrales bacterium]|nr:hypothetical protein [Candidatus Limnocylindrales bacterium]